MARPTQDALFARKVGAIHLVFHAHRSYLQKHGEPRTMEELRTHTVVGYDRVRPLAAAVDKMGTKWDRVIATSATASAVRPGTLRSALPRLLCALQWSGFSRTVASYSEIASERFAGPMPRDTARLKWRSHAEGFRANVTR